MAGWITCCEQLLENRYVRMSKRNPLCCCSYGNRKTLHHEYTAMVLMWHDVDTPSLLWSNINHNNIYRQTWVYSCVNKVYWVTWTNVVTRKLLHLLLHTSRLDDNSTKITKFLVCNQNYFMWQPAECWDISRL